MVLVNLLAFQSPPVCVKDLPSSPVETLCLYAPICLLDMQRCTYTRMSVYIHLHLYRCLDEQRTRERKRRKEKKALALTSSSQVLSAVEVSFLSVSSIFCTSLSFFQACRTGSGVQVYIHSSAPSNRLRHVRGLSTRLVLFRRTKQVRVDKSPAYVSLSFLFVLSFFRLPLSQLHPSSPRVFFSLCTCLSGAVCLSVFAGVFLRGPVCSAPRGDARRKECNWMFQR